MNFLERLFHLKATPEEMVVPDEYIKKYPEPSEEVLICKDNYFPKDSLTRKKHGFTYCGIIYLESGDERLAYQRIPPQRLYGSLSGAKAKFQAESCHFSGF